MKVILFCQNAYAFGILAPIRDELVKQEASLLWYIDKKLLDGFPYYKEKYTSRIADLQEYKSDIIFSPGNEVPYYIRGVKVQIFHGLAGEKKGHFKIRHYFDLYLTQGPYFTERFIQFRDKYKNFEVTETGWPKLDVYATERNAYTEEKKLLLREYKTDKIVLYAPTFSPSLTSAPFLVDEIKRLAEETSFIILVKFHDLMHQDLIDTYKKLASETPNIIYVEERNIIKSLILADIMVSDTSSVIYEFLLLNKPVITYKNINKKIFWDNSDTYDNLTKKVRDNLENDTYAKDRDYINQQYHPYTDGKSAMRMINAAKDYIAKNGVPKERSLPQDRIWKINKIFGGPVDIYSGKRTEKLSALLITYNEIRNITAVLDTLSFADEIVVIDSHSDDGTVEKIQQYKNVKLIQHPFKNYTDQKSFALEQAIHNWILFIDADERITDPLQQEILATINSKSKNHVAYFFYRKFMFHKSVLRFCGWQRDKNYRLFKKDSVSYNKSRIVHETLDVRGTSGILKNKLVHLAYYDYDVYKQKRIRYAYLKAEEDLDKGKKPNLYNLYIKPIGKFLEHYIVKLGILDGKKGAIISYIYALATRKRYTKLKELTNALE